MLTIHSDDHRLHHAAFEWAGGERVPAFETPQRADQVLAGITTHAIGQVIAARRFGRAPIERVHDAAYVEFLSTAWARWQAAGRTADMLPYVWPGPRMQQRRPADLDGELGYFSCDVYAPITAGTWTAACAAADVALSGQARIDAGERAVFSLCRPPGHHAGIDYMAGYCYFNNAAIAAQAFLDGGRRRVAILDIDYHHGNGTQDIFYTRDDVLFVSLHADPREAYPRFTGFAEERGSGAGAGYTVNYPLPSGSTASAWFCALGAACEPIVRYRPEVLIVSLGVDTYEDDPISSFKLRTEDYREIGTRLARLGLPTQFVMEGGYAIEAIGRNVCGVLAGFDACRSEGVKA